MFRSMKNNVHTSYTNAMKWLTAISFVVFGAAYCLPMFASEGIPVCDDTTFHLGRLVGLSNVWISPINFDSFGHNGLMVNVFYPWLTMYPMWIFYKISGSYVVGYKMYYAALSIATLFIAYYSMHGISKSRFGAYLFALLYTFSSYRFADVYNRAALGEAIALTFLPIVLLGIYKIAFENQREWHKLAIGMTLLAYSHVLSLLMSAVFVGVLFLSGLMIQGERMQRLIAMLKAACLSLALSAAMIVPMMEQFIRNDLYTPSASGKVMADSADSIAILIKYSIECNPVGRGIGLTTLVALVLSCLLLAGRTAAGRKNGEPWNSFAACLLLTGLVIALCSTSLLPWRDLGDNTPLSTIQFVWRFNAYTTLAFTASFSLLISNTINSSQRNAIITTFIGVVLLSGFQFCSMSVQNNMLISKDKIMESDIATWSSKNVDYAPCEAQEYKVTHGKTMEYIFINNKKIKKSPTIRAEGSHYLQEIEGANENRRIDIPVFKFYNESVLLDGKTADTMISERGTTLIDVPSSETATIEISYKYTMLARMSWIASIVICIWLLLNLVVQFRNRV